MVSVSGSVGSAYLYRGMGLVSGLDFVSVGLGGVSVWCQVAIHIVHIPDISRLCRLVCCYCLAIYIIKILSFEIRTSPMAIATSQLATVHTHRIENKQSTSRQLHCTTVYSSPRIATPITGARSESGNFFLYSLLRLCSRIWYNYPPPLVLTYPTRLSCSCFDLVPLSELSYKIQLKSN